MWLEWILDEGNRMFSDVSLWMRELLFFDENLEEDVFFEKFFIDEDFPESVAEPMAEAMAEAMVGEMADTINFPMQMSAVEEVDVLQRTLWQDGIERASIFQKETGISEEAKWGDITHEEPRSIWQKHGIYNAENVMESKENRMILPERFSEPNWIDGGKADMPAKSIELQQIEWEQKQVEAKMVAQTEIQTEAQVKEENRKNTINETKIAESTSAEFDINLLMETFEKKLWTARQKGGSRLIQR